MTQRCYQDEVISMEMNHQIIHMERYPENEYVRSTMVCPSCGAALDNFTTTHLCFWCGWEQYSC